MEKLPVGDWAVRAAVCRLPKGLYSLPVTSGWWSMQLMPELIDRQLEALETKPPQEARVLLHFGPHSHAVEKQKLRRALGLVEGLYVQTFSETLSALSDDLGRIEALSVAGGLGKEGQKLFDLIRFPRVRSIAGHQDCYLSIEAARGLEEISLVSSKNMALPFLQEHQQLRRFGIVGSGAARLLELGLPQTLEALALVRCRALSDVSDISEMQKLLELEIESCRRLTQVHSVGQCAALKYLMLHKLGPISDIAFVENLQNLEFISFMDVNVLDGRVERLRRLSRLKYAAFDNKRHYDARMENIAPGPFSV